ncbi:YdeI family protein [Leucobacter luti]|uniref:YdeI/OmpD-associated family protein n=1 Tax=Leucobacter luti TaxID=340320 RepID=UPI001C68B2C3|nr:YdeI/OmpD-associated family protein [Leucobacter luti]QYM75107.1 YdeI/OmpD-associated family protein [Leucobacter luti]
MVNPLLFTHANAFDEWLEAHHTQTTEAWLLFHKKGSGKASLTWSDAVDVALCFGWIDGLRKSVDRDSYQVRFTPRKKNSVWSSVNIRKVETLMRAGRMRPTGLALFAGRTDPHGYSSETRKMTLSHAYEQQFTEHRTAWENFSQFAASYRRDSVWWVMSAKKEEKRLKRLDILISCSFQGQRVPVFRARTAPTS